MNGDFATALEARSQDILDNCTRCGGCFEVCPMTAPAGLAESSPKVVTEGIIEILRGNAGTEDARRWAQVCSGSGSCIPHCQHGVNPRFMLSLARLELQRQAGEEECHSKGGAAFAAMSRGVHILSRIQLPVDVLERFNTDSGETAPDLLFYTGCNVLKTPHIVLLCLDILDALGASYEVVGGPRDCCGVLQFRTGDVTVSGRIAYRTTDRFASFGAKKVLSWCPTCQVQMGEVVLPGRASSDPSPARAYDLEPFVMYLAQEFDRLRPLLRHRVDKRVALHEHPGVAGVSDAALRILAGVPGLTLVELEQPRVGWMCNTLQPLPEFKRDLHRGLLEAAAAAGVTTLAGVYHACHRELCSHETEWPFEVVNFLELVGESMGIHRADSFKRLKAMQDVDAILADVADLAADHGLKLDEVRKVIARDLLGEQPLPLRGESVSP